MPEPAFVVAENVFFPLNDTAATCLTQHLPFDHAADILLLGCGDARNVLYTISCDVAANIERRLDFTCCDIEPAITGIIYTVSTSLTNAARNIVLYSLLIDKANQKHIWNIYFHFYIDNASLSLLQTQSTKLYKFSNTIGDWQACPYGAVIKMVDIDSLAKIRKVWQKYAEERHVRDSSTDPFKRAKEYHKSRDSYALSRRGSLSANPAGMEAMEDSARLFEAYWTNGAVGPYAKDCPQFSNATFMASGSVLYHGIEPLSGFHLTTAYVPVKSAATTQVKTAQAAFEKWSVAFRQHLKHVNIRVFVGDALALSHALRGQSKAQDEHGDVHLGKGSLLGYSKTSLQAPSLFDVIDTSDLANYGSLNLIVATSVILKAEESSTLFTNALVWYDEEVKALLNRLVCGDFATLSILLGLFPVEYWANFSASFINADAGFEWLMSKVDGDDAPQQRSYRIAWKRPMPYQDSETVRVKFEEPALAKILLGVYLNMFEGESLQSLFTDLPKSTFIRLSLPLYNRGTYASFLHLVRQRTDVDWAQMLHLLTAYIEADKTLRTGSENLQDLHAQLHLRGLLKIDPIVSPKQFIDRPLPGWNKSSDLPGIIHLSLRTPRSEIDKLVAACNNSHSPPLQVCLFSDNRSTNYSFSSLQLAFGKGRKLGHGDTCEIIIDESSDSWTGTADLFVSVAVPTWVAAQATHSYLRLQPTPGSARRLSKIFGQNLKVHESLLSDEMDVFLTRQPPQLIDLSIHNALWDNFVPRVDTTKTVLAQIDPSNTRITTLVGRVTISKKSAVKALQENCAVALKWHAPWEIGIKVDKIHAGCIQFPAAVQHSKAKTRVARKSRYVEIEAPVATVDDLTHGWDHTCHVYHKTPSPILWNMHYLHFDALPIIDITQKKKMTWLLMHEHQMFSHRERTARDESLPLEAATRFKVSLSSLFTSFAGLRSKKTNVWALGEVINTFFLPQILIFASSMRLDLSNGTAVLDCAVLPFTNKTLPLVAPSMQQFAEHGFAMIAADRTVMNLWKRMLPAYVERCRSWKHKPDCEYLRERQIPISTEFGLDLLCSCGHGTLSASFVMHHIWPSMSKWATRAAISLAYPVAFVEEPYNPDKVPKKD